MRRALALFLLAATTSVGLVTSSAQATHPRPKGASPLYFSLVPAYNACGAPNRTHGPSLAFPSCNPPVQTSSAVTVGSPDANGAAANSIGFAQMDVKVGVAGPPDDSDVLIEFSVSDVRCVPGTTACGNANAADGADYTGELQAATGANQPTDHWNAVAPGGGSDAATVIVTPHFVPPFNVACAATLDPLAGSDCQISTSANTIVPGTIKDAKRTSIEVGHLDVTDGGPDGLVGTTPNTLFAVQGVFVP